MWQFFKNIGVACITSTAEFFELVLDFFNFGITIIVVQLVEPLTHAFGIGADVEQHDLLKYLKQVKARKKEIIALHERKIVGCYRKIDQGSIHLVSECLMHPLARAAYPRPPTQSVISQLCRDHREVSNLT